MKITSIIVCVVGAGLALSVAAERMLGKREAMQKPGAIARGAEKAVGNDIPKPEGAISGLNPYFTGFARTVSFELPEQPQGFTYVRAYEIARPASSAAQQAQPAQPAWSKLASLPALATLGALPANLKTQAVKPASSGHGYTAEAQADVSANKSSQKTASHSSQLLCPANWNNCGGYTHSRECD